MEYLISFSSIAYFIVTVYLLSIAGRIAKALEEMARAQQILSENLVSQIDQRSPNT